MTAASAHPNYEVVATDLDDTLLCNDGAISPRTMAALSAWQEAGRRIVVATGRPPRSIGDRLPHFLHTTPWICYNGAEIRIAGETIYRRYIPENRIVALVERLLVDAPETTIGIELDDALWLNRPRQSASASPAHHRVGDLRTVAHLPTAKVLLFSPQLEELLTLIHPLPAGVRLMPSGRYPFVQLMAHDADKVTALHHLLEAWKVDIRQVVAFGDDVNDVDLLREAGLGVAVANAFQSALDVADRVTAANDEDGVAIVLEELLRTRAPHTLKSLDYDA